MRKMMIIPAVALSLMTFGALAGGTVASAHQVIHTGEDGDDTPSVTAPSGGGDSTAAAAAAAAAAPRRPRVASPPGPAAPQPVTSTTWHRGSLRALRASRSSV